jgi:glycogen operon protein
MSANGALEHGAPAPLGAHVAGDGINFGVHAPSAERIELCLFDPASHAEIRRTELPACTAGVWHGFLPGAKAGLLYGYRVHGPHAPEQGLRFNPNKLLIDPYARALAGTFAWHDAVFGHDPNDPAGDLSFDAQDSAPYVPKCRVVAPFAPRARPSRPCIPWRDTVVYELHLRGYTIRHPEVPEPLRGKIAALAQPAVIGHLQRLGVTTIELLPIAEFLSERALVRRGLSNYWGYNPIAFCAPHRAYLGLDDASEIAAVVDRLHEAGIEVVLDVVFNHTAEGDEYGPTLSLRGIDNRAYYRLDEECPRRYRDFSGCGNTLDCTQPAAVELIHAALRYWATEIGVDGFRLDLATALGRDASGAFDAQAPLWRTLRADTDLAPLKLIVEPWDMAAAERGRFGAPFVEWNDCYRDGVRRFWRGDAGTVAELATRFAGSSDVFAQRTPTAGINFITAHDGFTLADLVVCNAGTDAANGGGDGPASDPEVLIDRQRRTRSLLATLMLSRGVPMLLAGDELSRTQQGNDNAYCQDDTTSWLDWTALRDADRDRSDFVQQLTSLRRQLGVLREECFWTGQRHELTDIRDIAWLDADGIEMRDADWHDASRRTLGILASEHLDREVGAQVFLALNAGDATVSVRLPLLPDDEWLCVLCSDVDEAPRTLHAGGMRVAVHAGCLCAFVPGTTPGMGVARDLSSRAESAGVQASYEGAAGQRRLAPASTLVRLLAHLQPRVPESPSATARTPQQCWMHPDLTGPARRWLLSVQWYGLHSRQSWGIGDFADLGRVAEIAATAGAAGVMLSPLHAPRLSTPDRASPYSPSNRLALNPLLISLPQLDEDERSPTYAEFLEHSATRAAIAQVRQASCVDYPAVARLKLAALRARFGEFRARHLGNAPSATGEGFRRFVRDHDSLATHALFEALDAHFAGAGISTWPEAYRSGNARAAQAFAHEHAEDVDFHAYLQWVASAQWERAVARARAAGLGIGFVTDLALGADRDGAEAWQWHELVVDDMELGAPADAFAPRGQAWGLPPWHPQRLADAGCRPFADLLDAVMRGAGAVRIDHIMGLMRQFWVPRGEPASRGTYVDFPFDALLEHLAQASLRNQCMIIGEDLGNVPRTLRERLAAANVLGYRIVYFERDVDGAQLSPQAYPHASVAAVATHDLPTLQGFEPALDIAEREQRGASVASTYRLRRERAAAVAALHRALADYGYGDNGSNFTDAAHRFLAATNSALAIVQIEDVIGMPRQANLPGTADAAPNWRQRLPVALDALAGDPRLRTVAGIFARRAAPPMRAPARRPPGQLSPYPD